jgi:hypothetical protein
LCALWLNLRLSLNQAIFTQRGAKPIISAEHRFYKEKFKKTSKTDAGHPLFGFPSLN